MSAGIVQVDELSIDLGPRVTTWQRSAKDIANPSTGRFRGQSETALAVMLDVDGNIDQVYGDLGPSGDVESLDRAIVALERVRTALTSMYGANGSRGRCFAQGDWGRCSHDSGHSEPHKFPMPDKDYPGYDDAEAIERAVTEIWEGSPA